MQNLKNWRVGKGLTQGELADKVGSNQKSYSAYETGRTAVPGEIQAKLRKLGYSGPFPHEEKAKPEGDFITREEFAEWRGYWKAGTENLLERLEDLTRKVDQLEKRRDP